MAPQCMSTGVGKAVLRKWMNGEFRDSKIPTGSRCLREVYEAYLRQLEISGISQSEVVIRPDLINTNLKATNISPVFWETSRYSISNSEY